MDTSGYGAVYGQAGKKTVGRDWLAIRRGETRLPAWLPGCLPAACPPALSHSRLNRVISHRLTGRGAGVVCLPSDRFHNHSLKNNIPGLQGDSYCISREEEKNQKLTRAGLLFKQADD
jgi:hypothetical protein